MDSKHGIGTQKPVIADLPLLIVTSKATANAATLLAFGMHRKRFANAPSSMNGIRPLQLASVMLPTSLIPKVTAPTVPNLDNGIPPKIHVFVSPHILSFTRKRTLATDAHKSKNTTTIKPATNVLRNHLTNVTGNATNAPKTLLSNGPKTTNVTSVLNQRPTNTKSTIL